MKYFPKIKGERIYLSPVNPEDIELYTKWINDPSVSDGLGNTVQLYSIDRERTALEELARDGYNFAIIKADGDCLLGNISFFDVRQTSRNAQCGLMIGEEGERNKGYGAEALRLLLGYGFHTLNLNNVMLKVFSFNKNAIACYRKIGFREIGRRREAYFLRGRYHDEIFMDILAADYNEKYGFDLY